MNPKRRAKVKHEIGALMKIPVSKVTQIGETKTGLYSQVFYAVADGKKVVLKKKLRKKPYKQNTELIALK